jgi:biotin carboxyl carrier protein
MKMEVPITSSVAGKVTAILKSKGDFVNEGETVIEMA